MQTHPQNDNLRSVVARISRPIMTGAALASTLAANPLNALSSQPIPVPMSAESFVLPASNGASAPAGPLFVDYLGRKAVYLPSGLISEKGSKMRDGTIDADVATKAGAFFAGIAFRIESPANLEIV